MKSRKWLRRRKVAYTHTNDNFNSTGLVFSLSQASIFCHWLIQSVWKTFYAQENFRFRFVFSLSFFRFWTKKKFNVVGVTFNELFSLLCGNILLFDRNFVSFQTTRDKLMHEIDKKHTHSHKTHAKSMDCCGFLYNRHKRKKLFCNKKNATNTQYGWTVYSTGFLFPIRIEFAFSALLHARRNTLILGSIVMCITMVNFSKREKSVWFSHRCSLTTAKPTADCDASW